MGLLAKLGLAAAACLLATNLAAADTIVKGLRIEADPSASLWSKGQRRFAMKLSSDPSYAVISPSPLHGGRAVVPVPIAMARADPILSEQ